MTSESIKNARNKLNTIDIAWESIPIVYTMRLEKTHGKGGDGVSKKKPKVVGVVRVVALQIQLQGGGWGLSKNRR